MFNYAELFSQQLDQKYDRESVTANIDGVQLTFIGGNTIKLPTIAVPGFKDHARTGGWNRQKVSNSWQPYKLGHDRDVEFFVDAEDVDETNLSVSAAKVTNEFEASQAIPEWDKYTISTILGRVTDTTNGVIDKSANFTALDFSDAAKKAKSIKDIIKKLTDMADKNVPINELQIRGEASIVTFLKSVRDGNVVINGVDAIDTQTLKGYLLEISSLTSAPKNRLFANYDYTDGAVGVPAAAAGDIDKIQLMLTIPSAIARPLKRQKIYLKGLNDTDGDEGDGYTYRTRKYFDVFVLKNKTDGVEFFVTKKS